MGAIETKLASLAQAHQGQMAEERLSALDAFQKLGLPSYGSEDYQRTNLEEMLSGSWVADMHATPLEGLDLISCIPSEAFLQGSEIPSAQGDAIAQLIAGLAPQRIRIRIPRGDKGKQYTLTPASLSEGTNLRATHLLIELEEEAEVELVCLDTKQSKERTASLQRVDIILARGSKLRYTDVEHRDSLAERISSLHLVQHEESEASIHFFSLGGGRTRNNYHCTLAGEQAKLSLGGVVLGREKRHIDNYSYISHSVAHCQSDELFKYILADEAYGVFTGRILVAIDAQKTEAYQNNRNLLLSPLARMQAKPQLEIYADDVRCSHGMTTGQLDEDALFYMRQRGIALASARQMLSIAYTEEVLQRVEDEALRDQLREQIVALL